MDATTTRADGIARDLQRYLAPGQVTELRALGVPGRRAICPKPSMRTEPCSRILAARRA